MTFALALFVACMPAPCTALPIRSATPVLLLAHRGDAVSGTWDGLYEPPGSVGGQPFALLLEVQPEGGALGTIAVREGNFALVGRFDAERSLLSLRAKNPAELPLELELTVAGEALEGFANYGGARLPLAARRTSVEQLERDLRPRTLALDRERPATFTLVGLSDEQSFAVDEALMAFAEAHQVVGLSVGIVLDRKLIDVRSLGWEDLPGDVPASGDTQYRWASISKPLTAVTAVLLATAGNFDLERDVRAWVPEYPEQGAVVTPRAIMGHLSGITHYQGAQRTWRSYEVPYPFEDRILALDIFKETPLLAAPGARYSYSTHAYSLLGAAMQRAGEESYEQLVSEFVLVPLGMTSTQPDFLSRSIAHRTRGYQVVEGGVVDSGDDDVSWKLPGGGWTSTVGDLGRFAAGLMQSELLTDEQKLLLWTPGVTTAGEATGYGLGFNVGRLDGRRSVAHSGAQLKAASFMLLLPDNGLAVVLMCNTEGTSLGSLADALMRLLVR